MPLRISGKNINIGEALRTHVSERLNAATGKYFDGSVAGHVTIEPEGSGYRTDCTLHLASGVTLQAEGRAQEVYASFDQTAARIESRLRRYKRKLKDRNGAIRETTPPKGEPIRYTVLERARRGRGCAVRTRIQAGGRRRVRQAAAKAFGFRRGAGAGPDRRAGAGFPPRHQ